jgi:hypothetical protein
MPKGPKGEKRPADVIGAAIMVAKIATGEIADNIPTGKEDASRGGKKGGKGRAAKLTPEQRQEIARRAAQARWKRSKS